MALVGPILTLSHHGVSSAVVEINYDNNAERLASTHARHNVSSARTRSIVKDGEKSWRLEKRRRREKSPPTSLSSRISEKRRRREKSRPTSLSSRRSRTHCQPELKDLFSSYFLSSPLVQKIDFKGQEETVDKTRLVSQKAQVDRKLDIVEH